MKYNAFIGRFQCPHLGHKFLFDKYLDRGERVLILIRDVEVDDSNLFTAGEIRTMLLRAFSKEVLANKVWVHIIPDIKSINYGRGVGYEVNCLENECSEEVKGISATEIRRQIRAGEDGWRSMVINGTEPFLEKKLSEES